LPVHVVRLGSPRSPDEGLRLGTVRRPPRGVPKAEFAGRDFYDLWLPLLSPSAELMAAGRVAEDAAAWARFERSFRAEMKAAAPAQLLDLLAAMSAQTSFAVGCYCEQEQRCHRSLLRALLQERGAVLAG
jgi:uncharacterized protein YeaO (DUF488 family)